jgi:hypothetical protein
MHNWSGRALASVPVDHRFHIATPAYGYETKDRSHTVNGKIIALTTTP